MLCCATSNALSLVVALSSHLFLSLHIHIRFIGNAPSTHAGVKPIVWKSIGLWGMAIYGPLPGFVVASFVEVTSRVRMGFTNRTAQSADSDSLAKIPRSILYNQLGHVLIFAEARTCGKKLLKGVIITVFDPVVSQTDSLYEQIICDGSADVGLLDTALDPFNSTVYVAYKVEEVPPFINLDRLDASDGTIDHIASFNWTGGQPFSLAASASESEDDTKLFVSQNEVAWVYENNNIDVALLYDPGITILGTRTLDNNVYFMIRDDTDGSLYLRRQKALDTSEDPEMDVDLNAKSPYTFFQPFLPVYMSKMVDLMVQKPFVVCGNNLYTVLQRPFPTFTEYTFMSFNATDMTPLAAKDNIVTNNTMLLSVNCDQASKDGDILLLLQATTNENDDFLPEMMWSLNAQLNFTSKAQLPAVKRRMIRKARSSTTSTIIAATTIASSDQISTDQDEVTDAKMHTFQRIKVISSPQGDLTTLLYSRADSSINGEGYLASQVFIDCRHSPDDPTTVHEAAFVCIKCSYAGNIGDTIIYPHLSGNQSHTIDRLQGSSNDSTTDEVNLNSAQSEKQCLAVVNAARNIVKEETTTSSGDVTAGSDNLAVNGSSCPSPYFYDAASGQCRFCTGELSDQKCQTMYGANQATATVVMDPTRVTLGAVGCLAGLVGLAVGIALHKRSRALAQIPRLIERGLQATYLEKDSTSEQTLHPGHRKEQYHQARDVSGPPPLLHYRHATIDTEDHRLTTQNIEPERNRNKSIEYNALEIASEADLSRTQEDLCESVQNEDGADHNDTTTYYVGLYAQNYLQQQKQDKVDREAQQLQQSYQDTSSLLLTDSEENVLQSAAASFFSIQTPEISTLQKQNHRRSYSVGASYMSFNSTNFMGTPVSRLHARRHSVSGVLPPLIVRSLATVPPRSGSPSDRHFDSHSEPKGTINTLHGMNTVAPTFGFPIQELVFKNLNFTFDGSRKGFTLPRSRGQSHEQAFGFESIMAPTTLNTYNMIETASSSPHAKISNTIIRATERRAQQQESYRSMEIPNMESPGNRKVTVQEQTEAHLVTPRKRPYLTESDLQLDFNQRTQDLSQISHFIMTQSPTHSPGLSPVHTRQSSPSSSFSFNLSQVLVCDVSTLLTHSPTKISLQRDSKSSYRTQPTTTRRSLSMETRKESGHPSNARSELFVFVSPEVSLEDINLDYT